MDENRDNRMDYPHPHHSIWKHILTGLMVFAGSFAAFYVVSDMYYKMLMNPAYRIHRMEKQFMKEQHRMDKAMKHGFDMQERFAQKDGEVFHLVETPDNYKIIIDLSVFDNDEKNVEVRTNDHVLTVIGAGIKDTRRGAKLVKFSQNYMFGDNVDLNNLTKMRNGNKYIITIPIMD